MVSILQANYELETNLQEEENKELKEKITQFERQIEVKDITIRN